MTDGGQVLIVEDSDTQALQLRLLLESEGYEVERAASAENALDMLNQRVPDLIIADLHLPGMDGRALSRQIRLNPRTRATPVLMLTSGRDVDLERQGLESGADAYLPKSAGRDLVLLRTRALLRQRSEHGRDLRDYAPFRRSRVLLAHDSPTARMGLLEVLKQEGHQVEAEADPQAVLDLAGKGGFDCVVVNLGAHAFDGLALCRDLARSFADSTADTPSIMGLGGGENPAPAFQAGADDVAPANTSAEVFAARVRALLRRRELAEDARRADAERREHDLAVAASAARATMVQALEAANADLEGANRRLLDAQAKLVQAAKMASLGELVAGIAHEINNPLAFILGHHATVERLMGDIAAASDQAVAPKAAKARDRLGAMHVGLKRIQDLVLNLRRFSRMDEGAIQTLHVPEAIETVLALLAHKLGPDIEVRRRFEAPPHLEGSPALLNQVVMNMVSNAADAVAGKGVIEIATQAQDGRYRIAIMDSGPGVPPGLRDRVFEPFFTTKPVGAGTGLGLAIAYNVVEAHQGSVAVEDSPLGGAAFVITVPQVLAGSRS